MPAAAEPGDNRAKTIVTDTPATETIQGTIHPDEMFRDQLSPLPANVDIRKCVVGAGGAEVGTTAADAGRLVYSNTLGPEQAYCNGLLAGGDESDRRAQAPLADLSAGRVAATQLSFCHSRPSLSHAWWPMRTGTS